MSLLQRIRDFVTDRAIRNMGFEDCEIAPVRGAPSERQHQALAAEFVRKHGSITLKDIREFGCNCPSKTLHRLRKAGVVGPMCMDTWENNGRGRFKRYWRMPRMAERRTA